MKLAVPCVKPEINRIVMPPAPLTKNAHPPQSIKAKKADIKLNRLLVLKSCSESEQKFDMTYSISVLDKNSLFGERV